MPNAYLRIIDANFNRAKEALRACEEIARFRLEDKPLTTLFKKSRHQLSEILLKFPVSYKKLLNARASLTDVGRKSALQDGGKKPDWKSLMTANLKRSQESLRVLEEFSKVVAPSSSASFQKLRFQVYDLEKRSAQKF